MKKYLIFDLDGTLINSTHKIIDVIEDYFYKNYPDYYDNARYFIESSQGMSLQEQMENVFQDKQKAEDITKKLYGIINNLRDKVHFIPGTQETIKSLSKKYKLFLTTGSSTEFATETLKNGGINNCFELIYGSDKILKGKNHLNIFKEYSNDEEFFEKSIYIGDGEMDKIFANDSKIDFIRVGYKGTDDEIKIKSVKELITILNKI